MFNGENKLYEFDKFRFDSETQKLSSENKAILLSPKASELLECLLKSDGKFVSKEEIFNSVWADTFVEEGVLTQNIYTLRKALGTNSDGLPIIENKTRLGYRITVPITISESQSNGAYKPEIANGSDETVAGDNINSFEHAETAKTIEPVPAIKPESRKKPLIVLVIGAILLITIASLGWVFANRKISSFFRKPIETVKFTQITNTGDLANATLSPDGNFLAFVRGDKVFLKDIVSEREIPLDIPNVPSFSSLQFSADGNFLYFRNTKSPHAFAQILKTSRLGGESQLIAEKSYATFNLSPDNKFLAYYSVEMPNVSMKLFVKNLETKETREIYASDKSASVAQSCVPAWSPDGKKILHVNQLPGNQPSQLLVIDVATTNKEEIKLPKLRRFEQAAWMPDGESFIISATEAGRFFHLWKVYYPDGEHTPITNGLSSYKNVAISADGKRILAIQSEETSNTFIADESNVNEQKSITTGNSNNFGQSSLNWIDEQKILFSSQDDQELVENIWSTDVDGRAKRQITNERDFSATTPASDGKYVYYSVNRNGVTNISRASTTGEDFAQITNETNGSRRSPQVSADSSWIYYIFRGQGGAKIMRRNTSDEKEEIFFENEKVQCGTFLAISSDGKYLACPNWRNRSSEDSERPNSEIAVFSTENKDDVKIIQINGGALFRFSPDGKAIDYLSNYEAGSQIMRQTLDKTEAQSILRMPKHKIFNFAWSKSGKQLAISQGSQYKDAVVLTNFE